MYRTQNYPDGYKVTGAQTLQHNKSALIIHKFHICEFAYSLKLICKPQIPTHALLQT